MFLAQTSGNGGFDFTSINALVNYGILGVVAIGLWTRKIVPGSLYEEEKAQRMALEASIQKQVIPLVQDQSNLISQNVSLLESLKSQRDEELAEMRVELRMRREADKPQPRRRAP